MHAKFRIGIALQGGAGWIGGAEYCKNLLKALYRLTDQDEEGVELVPISEQPVSLNLYADMPGQFQGKLCQGNPGAATPARRLYALAARHFLRRDTSQLPQLAKSAGLHFLYPYGCQVRSGCPVPSAGWIPDFQHRYYPEFFSRREWWARELGYRRMAKHASCVVLSSQAAARDFRAFFPNQAHKTYVLSFRTVAQEDWLRQDCRAVCRKYGLPERFVIVCNQFWQHKNHRLVFEALAALRARSIRPVVVCTGSLHDHRCAAFAQDCMQRINSLGLAQDVILLGLIPRLDQIQLMRAALGVIQPSLFEGWSTVVEDARTLGKRIALSDIAVHREQDPSQAEFFDPQSSEQLAAVLQRWWKECCAGLDHDREAAALAASRQEVLIFARRFLGLARRISQAA
jgi:glycosyltransferase involved in cell wall biosynthesis